MMGINEKEFEAALKVLEKVDIDATEENVKHYIDCDYLTFHNRNDGKEYCWYLDCDDNDVCIDIETFEEVNAVEKGLGDRKLDIMKERIYECWEEVASLMDDEKREEVHFELAPCSKEEFLKRYLELDPDFENVLESEF